MKIQNNINEGTLRIMKRLKELDEILKNSELTDKDAVELGRVVKRKAREKGWY